MKRYIIKDKFENKMKKIFKSKNEQVLRIEVVVMDLKPKYYKLVRGIPK